VHDARDCSQQDNKMMDVDPATSFMNASRIGILFWFYTSQGPYPNSSHGVMRDNQSIFNRSSSQD
jgi:hypothetical protein